MSSPTIRNGRIARRQEIPANLITSWQSSTPHGAKPQIRRPKTACERCRTAKVRCHGDGQHECDRCNSRGLDCKYILQAGAPPSPRTMTRRQRSNDTDRTTPPEDGMQMDFGGVEPADRFGGGDSGAAFQQLLAGSSVGWSDIHVLSIHPGTESLEQQQQQQMNRSALDPTLDWSSGMSPAAGLDLSGAFPSPSTTPSNSSATNNNASLVPSLSEGRPTLESLGLLPLITSSNAADLSWQHQLASQSCQCRTGLTQLIPNVRTALEAQRLDGVFQVTSDVVQQCQGIVSCGDCGVNCTDLICIMAVFQEADVCFEYMASKDDIDIDEPCVINVTVGSYAVAVDEQDLGYWRRMLVIQLVRRANRLLDSISARVRDMLRELDARCRLGRVNIDYLEAVVRNSRENFQRIMKAFRDEAGTAGSELMTS